MNTQHTAPLFAAALCAATLLACSDGNDNPDDMGMTADQGQANAPRGRENPPTLGDQIDRMGRPAISTATVGTFMPNGTPRSDLKDDYNANDNPSTWGAMYAAGIADMIAIYDGADTVCGNQLGYDASNGVASAYDFLAGVLADDRLVIDSGSGTCPEYLGYEAEVLGVVGEGGCGGRTPNHDVIDRSYSVLINGSLGDFNDAIAADSATHSVTTFPFLAAP
ncbi:MAG: hypothetical protein R3B40_26855 [Polyangiales bacterium]|nr:hypothetical protein [Myxococcales bacterium]MCB9660219.1 hypothetical protein [Sandaracinaceae bacterium]